MAAPSLPPEGRSEVPARLTGWRVCVGRPRKRGLWLVRPLMVDPNRPAEWAAVAPGTDLRFPCPVHVGTTRRFVLDHYAGCSWLDGGEVELLLELDCTGRLQDPDHAERWLWPCGTEALVRRPRVLSVSPVTTKDLDQ